MIVKFPWCLSSCIAYPRKFYQSSKQAVQWGNLKFCRSPGESILCECDLIDINMRRRQKICAVFTKNCKNSYKMGHFLALKICQGSAFEPPDSQPLLHYRVVLQRRLSRHWREFNNKAIRKYGNTDRQAEIAKQIGSRSSSNCFCIPDTRTWISYLT